MCKNTGGCVDVRVIAVIPARYASERFPGKPLAKDTGKFLIQHVYEQVIQSSLLKEVIIATDDQRIADACDTFGASWRMTRVDHPSGTDRIAEVAAGLDADIIVNVQGDEPLIDPRNIDELINLLHQDRKADMATLSALFSPDEDVDNPNIVKVVVDCRHHALYFSRCPIPFIRDKGSVSAVYRQHLGLYAYRKEILLQLSRLPASALEKAEKLEQLRALENGLVIAVKDVRHPAVGIDTPQQYREFVNRFYQNSR